MTAVKSTSSVLERLAESRELVEPSMRAAVEGLDEHSRLVASYHLGWCDEQGNPRQASGGKGIRSCLTLMVADAVAGSPEPGVPGGVAVELVHNFSLIHDDLMDRDTERRHRPTVWAIWGDATAVLVGDALASLADEVLSECQSPHAQRAGHALAIATRELIRGQVLDVAFESRDDVGVSECFRMAAGKTGSLLGVAAQLGAILGGAGQPACEAFRRYGWELGLAFQLIDDLLGIWGVPERTGKPVFSDLRAHKKTLPVVWAMENGGDAGRELADWLATSSAPTEADLQHAAGLVERAGGRTWAVAEATNRMRQARGALNSVFDGDFAAPAIASGAREQFDELAQFVVARQL
jgi:geranylgeranyl diphosphate synthase, type I